MYDSLTSSLKSLSVASSSEWFHYPCSDFATFSTPQRDKVELREALYFSSCQAVRNLLMSIDLQIPIVNQKVLRFWL